MTMETLTGLQDYRDRMEGPMEGLAHVLDSFGITVAMGDSEMVAFATGKLKMMHEMLIAAGITPGILAAALKG